MLQQKGLEKTMMKTNVTKINDNKKRDRIVYSKKLQIVLSHL